MAKIDDIHADVGELRGTIDTFIDEMREKHRRDDINDADREKRLRSVEKKQYWMSGVAAAVIFVVQHYGSKLLGGGSQV